MIAFDTLKRTRTHNAHPQTTAESREKTKQKKLCIQTHTRDKTRPGEEDDDGYEKIISSER